VPVRAIARTAEGTMIKNAIRMNLPA
jgi:hypothetical protein